MHIEDFLNEISDNEGPLQISAAEVIERMDRKDFLELILEIDNLKKQKNNGSDHTPQD